MDKETVVKELSIAQQNSRKCEWCREEISKEAMMCSHCGKLRRDIWKDKILCYGSAGLAGLSVILIFVGMAKGIWNVTYLPERTSIYQIVLPVSKYSVEKFFTSGSGLCLFIAFVIFLFLHIINYVKVSKKLKTWIWF
jgi:hypothetical protein